MIQSLKQCNALGRHVEAKVRPATPGLLELFEALLQRLSLNRTRGERLGKESIREPPLSSSHRGPLERALCTCAWRQQRDVRFWRIWACGSDSKLLGCGSLRSGSFELFSHFSDLLVVYLDRFSASTA